MVHGIDDNFLCFQDILQRVFGRIISYTSRRREYKDSRACAENIEEAERTEIHVTHAVHGTGKSNGSWRYRCEQQIVDCFLVRGGGGVEGHGRRG